MVKIRTRCRIPIWRTFGRIPWHVNSHLPICRVLPPGEFSVIIPELCVTLQGAATGRIQRHVIQSHVSHCRVLPLGEFTVMITEPHAALQPLQGAVTWRNQCHDRATLQGVIIPSAILKIVLRHILLFWIFKCYLGFDERQLSYRLRYTYFKRSRFPVDSHWELQFSNPEKGLKSEENNPLVIRRLATRL